MRISDCIRQWVVELGMPAPFARHALAICALAALLALTIASPPSPARAEGGQALHGVALVIGESDYENIARLANPGNDARAVEEMLDSLGFETDVATDRDGRRLRRDLESFIEDAEGADVAIIYYSGHGIEAGGENYLVPVDADVGSLDDAGEKLVPLSKVLGKLKMTVPVTIVLLDACRNDPFPPGSILKTSPDDEGKPIGAGGLGETRGVVALKDTGSTGNASDESLGQVIGFAAEPGKVALDGDRDGNSPYAAAILRHLGAMQGQEFGIVLRMIGEEVYLKTNGQQRPWVNESLRRLLYFGGSVDEPTGDEGEILTERRQLLLTIADLPSAERGQIETIAAEGGVPMDALYAMLKVLGTDKPSDPVELEKLLKGQTEKLKTVLAEREALKSTDPEIVRLSGLADHALKEGALGAAKKLYEQAKARVAELSKTVDQAEADLKARRIEFAEVYAKSADTYSLAFEYLKAAEDYRKAFEQVERWDGGRAWQYRQAEADALRKYGDQKGDNDALMRSIEAYRYALTFAPRGDQPDNWAATQNNLGIALQILGQGEVGTTHLAEAVAAYRAALEEYTRERAPLLWATTQNNLGTAFETLGEREAGTARLEEAVAAFHAALEERTRERVPLDWGATQNNLGNALLILGEREGGTARLEEAVAAYRAALEVYTRDRMPLDWAAAQNNLGNALQSLSEREAGTTLLEEAVAAYRAALEEQTRDHVPLAWAATQYNLGGTLRALGEREVGTARLEEAVAAYRSALEERTRDRVPLDWAWHCATVPW
jgi:uncharacterized caspase-like protein